MRVFSRWMLLLLAIATIATFLPGCGGNNATVGATVRPLFQVKWPALSRALDPLDALQSARSVKITIKGAVDPGTPLISGGSGRTDAEAVVNRDSARTGEYIGRYKLSNDVRTGSYEVVAEFYTQDNAVGTVVATGTARADIRDAGSDGEVAFAQFIPASNLQGLAIKPDQSIRVGQIKALDIDLGVKPEVPQTVLAFRPGSITLTINGDGASYLQKIPRTSFDVSQEEIESIVPQKITAAAGDLRVLAVQAGAGDTPVPVSVTVRIDNQSVTGTVTVLPSGLSVSVAPSSAGEPIKVTKGHPFQFTAAVEGPKQEDFSTVVRWSLDDFDTSTNTQDTTQKHLASVSGEFTGNPITFQAADAPVGARFRLIATSVQPAGVVNPPASQPVEIEIVDEPITQIQFENLPLELPASRRGSDGKVIYTRTHQFRARLVGPGNPIPQVEWTTSAAAETQDPAHVLGRITPDGLYTVPSQPGIYALTATSVTSVEGRRISQPIQVRVVAGDASIVIQ